jgi:signal recognition particle GTPase
LSNGEPLLRVGFKEDAMAQKSEIRDSTINALLEKAASRNYGQYLPKMTIKKVRGFLDEPVSFDFPVTAIIGPNGGGKTTVLGAAAWRLIPLSQVCLDVVAGCELPICADCRVG